MMETDVTRTGPSDTTFALWRVAKPLAEWCPHLLNPHGIASDRYAPSVPPFRTKQGESLFLFFHTAQFSTFNPRTRRNSRSLLVTSVNPAALACAAIHKSLFPIICPLRSSSARIVP